MPNKNEFDLSYPQKLIDIGLEIVGEYRGSRKHQLLRCLECGNEFIATPKSKMNNFRNHGYTGCPECTKLKRYKEKWNNNIKRIEEKFEILSEWNGGYGTGQQTYEEKIDITVRNKECGHVFTSKASNLLGREVNCPECNRIEKIRKFQQHNIDRHEKYLETASDWKVYKSEVIMLTNRVYRENRDIINPNNLPRGLAGVEGAYHLDHVLPIRYCFEEGIGVEECACVDNLQILDWRDNLVKSSKVSI
jgi:hypothetical protein